jgi:hypothetical protein
LAPITTGTLTLPPASFDPALEHVFTGDIVQLPGGALVAAMEGEHLVAGSPARRAFVVQSLDVGATWTLLAQVARKDTIVDPAGRLAASGWPLIGAAQPALARLGDGRLMLAASTVDDSGTLPRSRAGAELLTFTNLFEQIDGASLLGRVVGARSDRHYEVGPEYPPIVVAFSEDDGATWSAPEVLGAALGVMPVIAVSGEGTVALLTSAVRGLPRWGTSCLVSSTSGDTWSQPGLLSRFMTTGHHAAAFTSGSELAVFLEGGPLHAETNQDARWVDLVRVAIGPGNAQSSQWRFRGAAAALARKGSEAAAR